MTINLQKGQKIDLTKSNPNTKRFGFGLGWDTPADLDASAMVTGANKKRISDGHFVFYNNLKSPGDFVTHSGDNRTGEGDGDDETIIVDFNKPHEGVEEVVIAATIHDPGSMNFGQVNGAFIRVYDADTNEEIMRYDLNEDSSVDTAMEFGKIYKKDGEYKFQALGASVANGLEGFLNKY